VSDDKGLKRPAQETKHAANDEEVNRKYKKPLCGFPMFASEKHAIDISKASVDASNVIPKSPSEESSTNEKDIMTKRVMNRWGHPLAAMEIGSDPMPTSPPRVVHSETQVKHCLMRPFGVLYTDQGTS